MISDSISIVKRPQNVLAILFCVPLILGIAGCSTDASTDASDATPQNTAPDGGLFPGASASDYSGDCGGQDIVGRYTMNYDYASITDSGNVNTGSKSEWHLHTQKGCFLWGLGLWSKPEENKEGCVNWILFWEENGAGPLVGMYKDVAGDRFLGYGEFDPKTSLGVVWDQFEDPKMEAVYMNKSDDENLYSSCDEALAKS